MPFSYVWLLKRDYPNAVSNAKTVMRKDEGCQRLLIYDIRYVGVLMAPCWGGERERERERETETETETERETDRARETETERQRQTDRHTHTERETDRDRETERDRDRERQRQRETDRDRERETETDRQTHTQREREREREDGSHDPWTPPSALGQLPRSSEHLLVTKQTPRSSRYH